MGPLRIGILLEDGCFAKMKASTKRRLLTLQRIFQEYTDDQNGLSIYEIKDKLKEFLGTDCTITQKALTEDIKELHDSGFVIEVETDRFGKKFYSHCHRGFNIYELRMMMDAVCSARFISEKESAQLIDKIKGLTSKQMAERLQNQIFLDDRVKAHNEQVKYHIDLIHTAIAERKTITFQYGRYNLEKDFVLSHNGEIYHLEPYALIWNQDYYYLIGKYNGKEVRHYRLDRIKHICLQDQSFENPDFKVASYLKKTFKMYAGEETEIEMLFRNSLVNVVLDYFGTEIELQKYDSDWFEVHFTAANSDGLIRWILTWGQDVKVLSPQAIVERIKKETHCMRELYNDEIKG